MFLKSLSEQNARTAEIAIPCRIGSEWEVRCVEENGDVNEAKGC